VTDGQWIDEVHEGWLRTGLALERVLFDEQSPYQRVTIVDTVRFGRGLLLDHLWMTAEGDRWVYHELIAHTAMTTARRIARVLIIGGGDGGTALEVLRYPEVERVDLVEIDGMVIDACREHLPCFAAAWADPRLLVTVGDGIDYAQRADVAPYDVILVDGADAVGPAEGLFGARFFQGCQRLLAPGGVLITQAGSPGLQTDVHVALIETLAGVFAHVHPFYNTVSLYPGGSWSWIYASDDADPTAIDPVRAALAEAQTHIWSRDLQRGALLSMPNHIRRALGR
jgi:spermidine synthase